MTVHTSLEWTPFPGHHETRHYMHTMYRGCFCEVVKDRIEDQWEWIFYDDASFDPELAVARSRHPLGDTDEPAFASVEEATVDMLDYIDFYIYERDEPVRTKVAGGMVLDQETGQITTP